MKIKDGTCEWAVRKIGGGKLSRGMIVAYSGKVSNGHPVDENDIELADWHVCDGTNGTPDLRGRFILGVSDGHAMGTTGGEEKHTLTLPEMPADASKGYVYGQYTGWKEETTPEGTYALELSTMSNSNSAPMTGEMNSEFSITKKGSNQPHNNMPPYYVLAYIMKL